MNWSNKGDGGGPWGRPPSGNGPTGGGPGGGNSGGGGGNKGRGPVDDFWQGNRDWLRNTFLGNGPESKRGLMIVGLVILLLWMASGIYRVPTGSEGVVTRFGAYHRITGEGLQYHLPAPIENVDILNVSLERQKEIGYNSNIRVSSGDGGTIPAESLMLTGDASIVDINFDIQWRIKDARDFLFNIRNPETALKSVAESAMREVMSGTTAISAFTEGKTKLISESKQLMQKILDEYGAGIEIVRVNIQKVDPPSVVNEAYRDVQSAINDKGTLKSQAEAYANDIIPRARGEAVKNIQDSEAYKQKVVSYAQGEAARFTSIFDAYKLAPEVTRKRLYLETMEEVLQGMDKVVIDSKSSNGVMPYLPLPELKKSTSSNTSKEQ